MNHTKILHTLILAMACLINTAQAATPKQPIFTAPQLTVLGGLIGCSYLLFHRESVKDFKPRYSLEKAKDIKQIASKEYFTNLWYFFYDGFIGQVGKTNKMAHGVLGKTAYYLHPLKKAGGVVAFAYMIYQAKLDIEEHVANLAKHKAPKAK